jgi:hypothetical protein
LNVCAVTPTSRIRKFAKHNIRCNFQPLPIVVAGWIIMFKAEVDKAKNLLKISYSQHVGPEDMKRGEEKIPALLAELRPGFRLLTVLTALESMDLACVPYIRRVMDLSNAKGVEMVVRVIPDPHKDIGLNILSLFHYRRRVKIVTCQTLAEARAMLAE